MELHGIKKVLAQAASINVFLWLAGLLIAAMIAGPLSGSEGYYGSFWFVALVLLLGFNILACVLWRFKTVPKATLVSHLGLLVIFAGACLSLGLSEKGDLALKAGDRASDTVKREGRLGAWKLPFSVRLKEFKIEYHGKAGHVLTLRQVKGRWAQTLEVEPGQAYALKDGGTLSVLEYNPDFYIDMETRQALRRSNDPNNPALRVRWKGSEKDLWIFENFPFMHQEGLPLQIEFFHRDASIKQFKSSLELLDPQGKVLAADTIWVNRPLRFEGVTFYQSGYDPADPQVSILRVARDPGVPLVYAGFAVLLAGLLMNALRRLT